MNVTPEAIERLRRLANFIANKGNSQKNGNETKKELDENGDIDEKENDTSSNGKTSAVSGRVPPEANGTNDDVPTPSNKQSKGEGAFQMDMDVFRQVLKDVITKRVLDVEKKVLAEAEQLKTKIAELEAQKKQLQCDSERLKQTLDEMCRKQKKQKVQMVSCETQVDTNLIEERPLSPEISKPAKPTFVLEKSNFLNQVQDAKTIIERRDNETVCGEQVVADRIDKQTVSLETDKNADRSGTPEHLAVRNYSETSTAKNASVAARNATNILYDKDASVGVSIRPPTQGQKMATEGLVSRDQYDKLHGREIHATNNPLRPLSVVHVEIPHPAQDQRSIHHHQSSGADTPQQTRGPSTLKTAVPSKYPYTQNRQGYFSKTSTESSFPNRPQFSSSIWQGPQPAQQANGQVQARGNGHVYPQTRLPVNNGPTDTTYHRSIATTPGGPLDISFFRPPKRRRVENMPASHGKDTNVVSSDNNYVMEHFKIQRTPLVPQGSRSQTHMQMFGHVAINQRPYATNPSNHLPGTHFNQGVPNNQPPADSSFHTRNKGPNHPSVALSQGQLVEKVFYPSTGSQPVGSTHQNNRRTSLTHQHPCIEKVHAAHQPAQPNGTMYVVQQYQVSRNRTAPLQQIAPAPAFVPRNPTRPPVQSPGISSTAASPSACHPGEPNAGLVPPAVSNPLNTTLAKSSTSQTFLKTPPKPTASIVVVQDGIVLSWSMNLDNSLAKIDNYELFACQDGAESTSPPIMWKKIGIVKALPLPMACTLTQFSSGNKYHFAVRAVDDQERAGPFSDPCTIALTN